MSTHRLTLWDGLACEGGEVVGYIRTDELKPDLVSGFARFAVDNSDRLEMVVHSTAPWLSDATIRRVIRLDDALDRTSEWRIDSIEDAFGDGETVRITAVPVHHDLGSRGLISEAVSGGRARYGLGGVARPAYELVDTFVIGALEDAGVDWVSRGTFEFTRFVSLAWDRWTPLQLMEALAEKLDAEWRLRRNGEVGYYIDLVQAIGSNEPAVALMPQRNLLRLRRRRDGGDLATVVEHFGATRDSEGERHGIEHAAWEVTAVSGNVVTLAARNGGPGPIAVVDQLNGLYLLKPDASLTEVTDSDVDQTVTVDDATGISVGDDVEFRKDSSGSLLTTLSDPTAIEQYGTVLAVTTNEDLRGERNYVRNPFFGDWTDMGFSADNAAFDGAHTLGTTVNLKNLTAGFVISAGDVLWIPVAGATTHNTFVRVATGDTADGSGLATVTTAQAVAGSDGQRIVVMQQVGYLPEKWSTDGTQGVPFIAGRPTGDSYSKTGAVDGAHSGAEVLSLKSLDASTDLYFGDFVTIGSTRYLIMAPATTDGSGNVDLIVYPAVTASDSTAATVARPGITGPGSDNAVIIPAAGPPPSATQNTGYFLTDEWTIRYDAGMLGVFFTASFTVHNLTGSSVSFGSTSSTVTPPKIELVDGSNNVLESLEYDSGTSVAAGGSLSFTLSVEHTFSADTAVRLRIYPVRHHSNSSNPNQRTPLYLTCVHWVSAFESEDGAIPPIRGSYGTELWQDANKTLARLSRVPSTYDTTLIDVATMAGLDSTYNAITLGTPMYTVVPDLGVVEELRVTEYTLDLTDPTHTEVVLDTRADLLTRTIGRRIERANRYITLDVAGAKKIGTAIASVPSAIDGARRLAGGMAEPPDSAPAQQEPTSLVDYEFDSTYSNAFVIP